MALKPKTVSRLAWSVGLISIALSLAAIVLVFVDRHEAVPSSANGWDFPDVFALAAHLAFPALGIVLVSRRPENRIGWLFLAAGLFQALSDFGGAYAVHALVVAPGSVPGGRAAAWANNVFGPISFLLAGFVLLLFPTGHLPSRRWRPVGWYVGLVFAGAGVAVLVGATKAWSNPFSQAAANNTAPIWFLAFFLTAFVPCAAAPIVRFVTSRGEERLQMKWFAVAALAALVTAFMPGGGIFGILQALAGLFLLTSIAIAVLKYRLYEIDVVINKAVVYGVLAAFFTAVYVAIVVGIGAAIGSARNPYLTLLAAVIIALAFNPVRERARGLANRIAYGKRATPYEVLSEFAERIGGTYSLEDVLPRTAQMLAEGTGATRADVWLLVGTELVDEGRWPDAGQLGSVFVTDGSSIEVPGASRTVAVRHQGELLGAVSIHKAAGDQVSSVDEKLLSDVASQAGLVLRNVGLIQDLRASRQRIVAAQDAAARRLERNIHDGAQQQLVALSVKLNLAQSLATREPERTEEMLAQLKAEAHDALENLRDLARGIYPPLLAEQGLVAALEAQARKAAVPTTIESDRLGRYAQEAEAAVYFCTLEALQNVAKYANASQAVVHLKAANGHLSFAVEDDGVGFDPSAKGYGTGMESMADRLAALGGELRVTSALGTGTLVEGTLPV